MVSRAVALYAKQETERPFRVADAEIDSEPGHADLGNNLVALGLQPLFDTCDAWKAGGPITKEK